MDSTDEKQVSRQRTCRLFSSDAKTILRSLIQDVSSIERGEKGKIQYVIITGSRERAFYLLACFCKLFQNSPIMCHASVGSLKLERDLKALHFGVDVLIVTTGRLGRLYHGNENCFDKVQKIVLDECELLFSKPIKKKVGEYMRRRIRWSITSRRRRVCKCSRWLTSLPIILLKASLRRIAVQSRMLAVLFEQYVLYVAISDGIVAIQYHDRREAFLQPIPNHRPARPERSTPFFLRLLLPLARL